MWPRRSRKRELADGVSILSWRARQTVCSGSVTEIAAEPTYLDIRLPAGITYAHPVRAGLTAFAYLFEGAAVFGDDDRPLTSPKLVVFGDGDAVQARAGDAGARFLRHRQAAGRTDRPCARRL